jgi:hypothetical protein
LALSYSVFPLCVSALAVLAQPWVYVDPPSPSLLWGHDRSLGQRASIDPEFPHAAGDRSGGLSSLFVVPNVSLRETEGVSQATLSSLHEPWCSLSC